MLLFQFFFQFYFRCSFKSITWAAITLLYAAPSWPVHGKNIFNDNAETLAVKIRDGNWSTRYIVTSIYASCTTLARRYRSTICATIRNCRSPTSKFNSLAVFFNVSALLSNYLVTAYYELVVTSGELKLSSCNSKLSCNHYYLVIKDFGCLTRLPNQRLVHVKQNAETNRK